MYVSAFQNPKTVMEFDSRRLKVTRYVRGRFGLFCYQRVTVPCLDFNVPDSMEGDTISFSRLWCWPSRSLEQPCAASAFSSPSTPKPSSTIS